MNNIRTMNTNATVSLSLTNGNSGILDLPALLKNALVNFNFTLDGMPVLSGVTGTLTITAQYLTGRTTSIGSINLATTTGNIAVSGKYTQLNVSLSGLTGADTVIIYADQDVNIV